MITIDGKGDTFICPQKFKENYGLSFLTSNGYFGQAKYEKSAEYDDVTGRYDEEHRY